MIVEFIGSTGAGKTTLITGVRRRLAGMPYVSTPLNLVAIRPGTRGIAHPTAQNLTQELVGFPYFVGALYRHKAFIAFVLRMLARQGTFTFYTLNYLRSLERTIGVNELITRHGRHRIVLVDEGTLILAHNVFVYTTAVYNARDIAKFAALVPLPDLIVYVRAPVDVLVQRSLRRSDPPKEMRSKDQTVIAHYVERAVATFEQLVQAENIRGRVLTVENPDGADEGCDTAVDRIAQFILNNQHPGGRVWRAT